MKDKWVKMYLDIAFRIAQESHAERLKVGAVFVSPDGVMSTGINGLPEGQSNECEDKEWMPGSGGGGWLSPDEIYAEWPCESDEIDEVLGIKKRYKLKTKPEVSHAEENCYSKMLQQGVSAKGGTLFLTHAPCLPCSKQIRNSGTIAVYYANDYKSSDGVNFLKGNNIYVEKVNK